MQVATLLQRDTISPTAAAAPQPGESTGRLQQTLLGALFIANSYFVEWLFPRGGAISGISAFIGALILAAPILWTSARDLMRGLVSINELVSLAVLASFATGDYKTAGVVSFFMLIGEIIETRTAAGARASIESLIQLTPTKARRVTATVHVHTGSSSPCLPAFVTNRVSSRIVPFSFMRRSSAVLAGPSTGLAA